MAKDFQTPINPNAGVAGINGLLLANAINPPTRATPGSNYADSDGPTKITVGSFAPVNPTSGDVWFDTNE